MKRSNLFVVAALFVSIILTVVSCQKNGATNYSGNKRLSIYLTDAPSFSFDAVFVEIVKMEIKVEDDSNHHESEHESSGRHGDGSDDDSNDDHGSGGWITININPGVYDLLSLRNGVDTLIASGNIPVSNHIQKIRITLGGNNSVVLNGERKSLMVKDQDNQVIIKLDDDMVNADGSELNLWLDFDASRSIEWRDNIFELRSNVKGFSKNKAGSIEGRVLPVAAKAVVYAINGTDTTSALPGREGEFKIMGLKAGSYKLLIHPTTGSFSDKVITSVVVSKGEDAHIGTIQL
jgi:hypothetical protein